MTLHYAIRPARPAAHLFHLTLTVDDPDPGGQAFTLPAWIPGSYMIREFARHVVRITALAGERKVRIDKTDKHTWRCAPVAGPLTLAWEVYAWDASVRGAHLDETHAFFNGASVFLLPAGRRREACRLDLFAPDGDDCADWAVATGLEPARGTRRGGFGTYLAEDYDALIDCPVEMGRFRTLRFAAGGVPHELALTGHVPALDGERLAADLARACEQQIRLFEPRTRKPPFERFVFLVAAGGEGYGGLEHRNSTALVCKRDDLPYPGMQDTTEGYRSFLGLASHEYFHAWHVKRIRPAALVDCDLGREAYTRLLWLFEGFTSYYDDLALVRAGLVSRAQYLDTLARTLSTVTQRSGRLKQSVAESSFDAWIKYYRQDENAPNSVVSYYQKGALVALALDLLIRRDTGGRRSLDDLMRMLWREFRRAGAGYAGVPEDGLPAALRAATGLSLDRPLREWTEGTRDPDFAGLLAPFGVAVDRKPALDSPHFALLGVKASHAAGELRIAQVHDGGPGQAAGLSAGDLPVALDGLRITAANLDALLARRAPGETVELLAFRGDRLMRFLPRLATVPPLRLVLREDRQAPVAARRALTRWLGAGR